MSNDTTSSNCLYKRCTSIPPPLTARLYKNTNSLCCTPVMSGRQSGVVVVVVVVSPSVVVVVFVAAASVVVVMWGGAVPCVGCMGWVGCARG